MSADPLADLARAAATGDRDALGRLCRKLEAPVFRLALRMLGRVHEAEDATQEILIQIITHLSQFEGRSAFLTWAWQIASRKLLRQLDKTEEAPSEPGAIAGMIDQGLSLTSESDVPSAEQRTWTRETQIRCTQHMLDLLTREERLAVVLVEVLGVDDAMGAEICEISGAAFRQRLSRGRRKVHEVLDGRCGLADSANPCRCERQVVALGRMGLLTGNPRHAAAVEEQGSRADRARTQLAQLHGAGRLFQEDPPLGPPASVWKRLTLAFPDALG
jgi:RNA polymerase sigma factor (sigma-70 family)